MTLFLHLLLGHMLGDYVFQPVQLVLMKRRGWDGILLHTVVVVTVTGILIWPVLGHWWYCLWLLFLAVSHALADRRRAVLLSGVENRGLWHFLLDQLLHISVLALFAAVTRVARLRNPSIPVLTTSAQANCLVAYVTGFIFLVWTVPILEVETMNALVAQRESIAVATGDRLLGALERIGAVALALCGLIWLSGLLFLPRLLLECRKRADSPLRGRVFAKTGVSLASAIFTSLLLAQVPLPVF